MASFEHAWALGYRYLETDVHRTIDGVLVAFHDADLRRTCGIERTIAEMTSSEVADARVRHIDGTTYPIPLMTELLDRFPQARFNIDAKADESIEPLAELVRQRGLIDRVCLASFQLRRLRRLRSLLGANLLTNMSPPEIAPLLALGRTPGRSPRVAQVPIRMGRVTVVTERFIAAAHRQGIDVHVWTINERSEIERLLDLGVDGIMTDDTDVLRAVLIERGLWSA
jgi:glycerophosphoryl diester phosphodiesterase